MKSAKNNTERKTTGQKWSSETKEKLEPAVCCRCQQSGRGLYVSKTRDDIRLIICWKCENATSAERLADTKRREEQEQEQEREKRELEQTDEETITGKSAWLTNFIKKPRKKIASATGRPTPPNCNH